MAGPTGGWELFHQQVDQALTTLRDGNRLRGLIANDLVEGRPDRIDLSHNDYLGLRYDTVFQDRCRHAVASLPVGAGGSRLLGGEWSVFREVERAFARFKGAPDALLFASGYAANESVPQLFTDAHFFSDHLNHASTIDGLRLTGIPRERRTVFAHGSVEELRRGLAASRAPVNVILCESLYSMDGDVAPLAAYGDLAASYRGVLVVDEAHAIGAMGPGGRGLVAAAGLDQSRLVTIDTCGKALGVQGAFVCGPDWVRDYLINVARPFIFSTALSPWSVASLGVAVDYMQTLDERRRWLAHLSAELYQHVRDLGYGVGPSPSHVMPVMCGTPERAVGLARALAGRGIVARAIRPPTVPEGACRVRLSLNAGLRRTDVDRLKSALQEVAGEYAQP